MSFGVSSLSESKFSFIQIQTVNEVNSTNTGQDDKIQLRSLKLYMFWTLIKTGRVTMTRRPPAEKSITSQSTGMVTVWVPEPECICTSAWVEAKYLLCMVKNEIADEPRVAAIFANSICVRCWRTSRDAKHISYNLSMPLMRHFVSLQSFVNVRFGGARMRFSPFYVYDFRFSAM